MRTKITAIPMATVLVGALLLITLGSASQGSCHSQPVTPPLKQSPPQDLQKFRLPLAFEEVKGPSGQVNFLARGPGYELLLTPEEAVFIYPEKSPPRLDRTHNLGNLEKIPVRTMSMKCLGTPKAPRLVAQDKMKGYRNYYVGKRPENWRTRVPLYRRVKYEGIYPGIDLVFYEKDGRLEYDFVVAPGADPNKIHLAFQGVNRFRVDHTGNLVFHAPERKIVQRPPLVYQEVDGRKKEITGSCLLKSKNRVAFALGDYDRSKPLIIDPAIEFWTYLGGGTYDHPVDVLPYGQFSNDFAMAVAVDGDSNVYVTGTNFSYPHRIFPPDISDGSFPYTTMLYGLSWEPGAFITKFTSRGDLLWSILVSGEREEFGYGIAVDDSGNVYATGYTCSNRFPILNGYQEVINPYPGNVPTDAFVVKVDSEGSLLYSTYLGGTSSEVGMAIAADNSGNAYVTGHTKSFDFPTKNALFLEHDSLEDRGSDATVDAFVAKVDTRATGEESLVFSTYLGGTHNDKGTGIALDAVDGSGNIYVAGDTRSGDFPVVNEYSSTPAGCASVFLSKLNSAGSELLYSTYLGSSDRPNSQGVYVAADEAGNAYLSGTTDSPHFPVRNGFMTEFDFGYAAFVTRINTNLAGDASLIYSTFLGGSTCTRGGGIAVENPARVYVTGSTMSLDFPLVNSPPPRVFGFMDIFIAHLNTEAAGDASLPYSTYVGGTEADYGCAVAIDESSVNVVGYTNSPDLPTTPGVFQESHANPDYYDCFVLRLNESVETVLPIPAGPTINYYPGRNYSVVGSSSEACMPVGWGNTCRGVLSMQVALPKFQGPMNLYLALIDGKDVGPNSLPDIFQVNNLYLIGPKGEVQPAMQNWTPWMGNQSNPVDRVLSVDISQVDLAGEYCYVALVAQPCLTDSHQDETAQLGSYTWVTRFPVPQNQQDNMIQALKGLNLGSGEVKRAIRSLENSLGQEYWLDAWTPSYLGKKIFDEHQKAVHQLMKVASTQQAITPAIHNIVKMDQILAVNAVVDAVAKRGAPNHLQQARKDMERAHQELKTERMDQAIIFFGKAWAKAEEALRMAKNK
jgi:hypothetical protein